MRSKLQHQIFLQEGDQWFLRNNNYLKGLKNDRITRYLEKYKGKKLKILEVGCSDGWRLNLLHKSIKASGYGIEPSAQAVAEGRKKFAVINLKRGLSHSLSFKDNFFDVVIVSFVLHWVDRSKLLQTIAEIDRVLKNFGLVLIQDFDPGVRYKTPYHHLPKEKVFTFKQKYWDIFVASGLYAVEYEQEFEHYPGEFNINNLARFVVLQKRGVENYPNLSL